ncbi:hypothetical protein [Mycoplasma sp. 1654_15]|uniref:hypothetical protein n=1 Tax=Mycoplasma sp. 1654_15 TaxID=2725994 RepID=UPI0020C28D31|nr:hypothetical protein [Mycoplasma sp. 1654_15]
MYKSIPNKKYDLDFNNWSMNKMVNETEWNFNYIKTFETDFSNHELFIKKMNTKVWESLKKDDKDFFEVFVFRLANMSSHFKITTVNNFVFYLKYSKISSNFRVYENENFLIVNSESMNENKKNILEDKGFKFYKEKDGKMYFWSPYSGLSIFNIIVKESSYFTIKESIKIHLETKLKLIDEIAKIINN